MCDMTIIQDSKGKKGLGIWSWWLRYGVVVDPDGRLWSLYNIKFDRTEDLTTFVCTHSAQRKVSRNTKRNSDGDNPPERFVFAGNAALIASGVIS